MKKLFFPLTGLTLAVCVLALSVGLNPAPPAEGYEGECDCGPDRWTTTVTKTSTDCQWTLTEIANAVWPQITCQADCLVEFEWTSSCHKVGPSQWQGAGRLHYQCGTCTF